MRTCAFGLRTVRMGGREEALALSGGPNGSSELLSLSLMAALLRPRNSSPARVTRSRPTTDRVLGYWRCVAIVA